ncbi:hypothetical protein PPL_11086 [Heterostelium album PN500]|uniref:Uncharacterized protein n=1 Tax=Heterostelium pallidum (strain ATCC 26659 / Pp 5 / PN500) TaxID=670386 RepID=D3BSW6_HETP5|nr:hypothetical protein PPL_11086 [Heterostelium album PN500]EFA75581.1 hypothetical protein PPL_11086 [Heterostelium album PN500]|eukprot:XP_020427715.1 hypothetical protein PPL_11086 [Heterostelium album PN500]
MDTDALLKQQQDLAAKLDAQMKAGPQPSANSVPTGPCVGPLSYNEAISRMNKNKEDYEYLKHPR